MSIVPVAPDWDGYYELIHELGHLFDGNAGGGAIEPWNYESLPGVGCAFAGTYPDDPNEESGYSHPFIFGSGWGPNQTHTAMDPDGFHSRYQHGAIWGLYFLPQFQQATVGSLEEGLLWRLRDIGFQDSTNRDYYWGRYPGLLEHQMFDDTARYPYLQDGTTPLSGDERLQRVFTNFVTAFAVNAPHIGVGEYSFSGGFDPVENWSFFRDNGINDPDDDDRAPNALTIPPDFDVTLGDTLRHTITTPIPYPDLPMDLKLKIYPWQFDLFEVNLPDTIDDLGPGTVVQFDIVGQNALYTALGEGYKLVLGAKMALYPDIGTDNIWQSGDQVITIVDPEIIENNGLITISCRIPADGNIRNAAIVVALMESGMPERWADNDHIRYDDIEPQTAPGWGYEIEYEVLRYDEWADPPAVALLDVSASTGLDYAGQPFASVAFDYDGDADEDLFVASSTGLGSLHQLTQVSGTGVPEFTKVVDTEFGLGGEQPQVDLKGVSFADYDNDGDLDLFAGSNDAPRLYRNNADGSFTDVAATLGVRPANDANIQCGVWGDFDGDGWIDLFLGRGWTSPGSEYTQYEWPNWLLKNEIGTGGSFVNSSSFSGIDQNPAQYDCTLGAAWADYDLDGDLDLFTPHTTDLLPGGANAGSHLYVNQGDATFLESSDLVFSENIVEVSGVSWVDIDSDADLDLVCSSDAGGYIGTRLYRNDNGAFNFVSEDLGLSWRGETRGAVPLDIDLDGMMDILTIPQSSSEIPQLHRNVGLPGSSQFVDIGSTLGLDAGSTSGQVAHDFNDDGDLDLFLGRPVANGEFFYKNAQDATTDAPENHWAAVEFSSDISCLDNRASIGATVMMRLDGIPRQVQVVDGGSMRGSQQPLKLTFGLGSDTTSSVQFTITWPSGVVATVAGTRDGTVVIGKTARGESPPQIESLKDVTAYYFPVPGEEAYLIFEWTTDTYYGCPDTVELSSPSGTPPECWAGVQTWTTIDSDAVSEIQLQPDGTYLHQFMIMDFPCSGGCSFLYKVGSGFNMTTQGEISPQKTLTTPYCLQ